MRTKMLMIFSCAALLCSNSALAQAVKAAAASTNLTQFHFNTGGFVTTPWVDAVGLTIKNPGFQGLFVTFNAQTLNAVSSTQLVIFPFFLGSTASEFVGIQARLLVDNVPVPYATGPGLSSTVNVGLDSQFRSLSRFVFSPPAHFEILALVTQSGGNRSVTWIVPNTSNGDNDVKVQVRFTSSTFNLPIPSTFDQVAALVGAKNLTVESVNLK